jgi:hypothetical protein
MVHFHPDPSAPGTEYYDIPIDDPVLTEYGFTKFRLPVNSNAIKMILDNDKDRSLITYVDFDKHDLEKSVKLLQDKLLDEQIVEDKAGKDTVTGIVAYFRNACVLLSEDSNNDFFKDGKSKKSNRRSKSQKSDKEQQKEEQDQKPSYTAYK